VFESVLHEEIAAASDLDLTVEFADVAGPSPARQYFDFKSELERRFARKVDLVELESTQDSRPRRIIGRAEIRVHEDAGKDLTYMSSASTLAPQA